MGFLSYAESHNRLSLPHTPPDLVSFGCSPAASYTSSASSSSSSGDAAVLPPKDLSWPHPKPPISPPMSSHDQPPPPSSALRSPARTAPSPNLNLGGMSMAATAAASLARASLASVTDASPRTAPVERPSHSRDDSTTATSASATRSTTTTTTTATAATSLTGSPTHNVQQQPTAPAPAPAGAPSASSAASSSQPERLPSLTSIFGLLDRPPLPPTSASAGPPPLRASYGRAPSPALPTPQSAYLPPPQSTTATTREQPQHYSSSSYHHHQDQRSPRSEEHPPASRHHYQPPSPRSYEHDQQHQQHQQHQQSSSHQWPDSRSGYVAVSKWSLQDGPKTEQRSSYSEHRPSYGGQHSPDSQRFSQPLPPSSHQSPASSNDHYRQSQQQQQHHHQQSPSHSYHGHGSHSSQPPPPPQQQRSPIRGSAPVADGRQPSLSGSLPPTPGSTAFAEGGAPPKEGMGLGVGPKIWTGQDFLPQFLRVAEVPGEGTCYFYDDGTHCKAVIDGEAVNPYWGVTKAGKPRKRLAIACMTCREKKIKCDPEYPRCVQCEKFGRLCRFKNAPRGGNNNAPGTNPPSATATEPDAHRKIGSVSAIRPQQSSETSPRSLPYAHLNNSNNSPRVGMSRPLSPTNSNHGSSSNISNKRRSDYDHYTTTTNRGRSPPFANRSPTLSDVSRGSSSVLPPPHGWGSASGNSQQSSQLPQPPPPPSSYPRSQQPYSPHSQYPQQHSPHSQYASHSQAPPPPPSAAYDHHHHRHSYPDHHGYPPSQPRSQPPSPSQPDLPRMLLPPPRSTPDLPRVHDDVLRRSWQSDL
ncbi:hypothetical protein SBRCBS47491_002088 [Sporothrix bragantina]|uniref:Zn(2)-C6 fungal-type domain-containing protein n=1 Tax=Sporothrix bragantina TaxID=671064 RepID=A0ABP0B451_9PEZI